MNYAKGLGVAQNWAEAVRWYRKAAEAGHAGAAVNLGQCYQNGGGVPRDRNEAIKWYRFAMEHGDPHAPGLLVAIQNPSPAPGSPRGRRPADDAGGVCLEAATVQITVGGACW